MHFKRKGFFETHKYKIKYDGKKYQICIRHKLGVWKNAYNIIRGWENIYEMGTNPITWDGVYRAKEAERELQYFIAIVANIESGKIQKKPKKGTIKSGSLNEYVVTELI